MQFRTKDLLITVLPKIDIADKELAKVCLFGTRICRFPTLGCHFGTCFAGTCYARTCYVSCFAGTCFAGTCFAGTLNPCGALASIPCPGGSGCPGVSSDPFVIENLEDLVTLRAELADTLKALDEIKGELKSGIGKEEADALEAGLNEALANVRAAKKGSK